MCGQPSFSRDATHSRRHCQVQSREDNFSRHWNSTECEKKSLKHTSHLISNEARVRCNQHCVTTRPLLTADPSSSPPPSVLLQCTKVRVSLEDSASVVQVVSVRVGTIVIQSLISSTLAATCGTRFVPKKTSDRGNSTRTSFAQHRVHFQISAHRVDLRGGGSLCRDHKLERKRMAVIGSLCAAGFIMHKR